MAESQEVISSKAELEERVRELEEENQGLKDQLLEYQYKTGERPRPPQKKTLKEYLALLNNYSTRGDTIDKGKKSGFIITDGAFDFDFSDGFWARLSNLGIYSLNVYLSYANEDGKTKTIKFKYFCSKRKKSALEEMLSSLVRKVCPFVVSSTSTSYHFVQGLVQEDGNILYFDDIKPS